MEYFGPAELVLAWLLDAVIGDPLPVGVTSVMNQASISGSNIVTVLTDDPGTVTPGDATVTLLPPDIDFGDAPTPYPTLLADDGARHVVPFSGPAIFLGAEIVRLYDEAWTRINAA